MRYFTFAVLMAVAPCFSPHASAGETLVIYSTHTSPDNDRGFQNMVNAFKQKRPDITVEDHNFSERDYKSGLGGFLKAAAAPDIVFWFPGERLRFYVEKGLIEDISDLWKKNEWHKNFRSTKSGVSFGGKQYALETEYYQWGFFYRKDMLAKLGQEFPKTWPQMLALCKLLRKNGQATFVLGAGGDAWPSAGWFDYLVLRLHGIEFYKKLAAGTVSWTDPKVTEVFDRWAELVKNQCYSPEFDKLSWGQSLRHLWTDGGAMMLMGNFLIGELPEEIKKKDVIAYAQFPRMKAKIPMFENAPGGVTMIPQNAPHKALARQFLEIAATPEVLRDYNISTLSPNSRSAVNNSNRYLAAGQKVLSESPGTIAFFDNEFPPDMANIAMNSFVEFLVDPSKQKSIQERLEGVRKRVYNPR